MVSPLTRVTLNLLLFLGFPSSFCFAQEQVLLDRLDGYVNSSPILQSDSENYLKSLGLRSQIDPLFANSPLAKKGKTASHLEIVEMIINDRLVEKEYQKSDAEVEQEITTIQTNNHIDRNTLKEALLREGYSFQDYFELIRDSASKKELIGREIQTRVSVTDDDVKNYYFNHLSKDSKVQRSFHLQMILVSSKNYKTSSAAIKIAQDALRNIRNGESFEEVARRVSDDATASMGGDLGTLTEDQMLPAIREELKKLKIGEVSDLFGGGGRQYILKLVDVKSAETEQLEKKKEEIRSQLLAKEYEQQVKLWVERKRQTAVVHVLGATPVAPTP